ncbi:MAG: hypothetical protein M1337_03740 [Actinobacteria bacterium]|nr:hypothetical protein [Actinomycetota bacterium]
MNAVVLVVAGIFVLAGVTLIVLSVVLFRGRKGEEVGEAAPPPDEALPIEPERAFIDEPLKTDFSLQLGPAVATGDLTIAATAGEPSPGDADADADAERPHNEVVTPPNALAVDDLDGTTDITAETLAPLLAPTETPTPPVTAQPDLRHITYSFRVGVAADHVLHGRLREAITEYEKALTLTDDSELRSQLLVEVGNAWRDLGELEPAAQAYATAAEQTANEGLRADLRRSADEMRRGSGSASEREQAEEERGPS